MICIKVPAQYAGEHLSLYISEFSNIPLKEAKNLISGRYIRLNEKPIKKDALLKVGDYLEMCIPLNTYGIKEMLVYEDENIMIINKPSGLDCDKLMELCIEYMHTTQEYNVSILNIPYFCYVVDVLTGGLMLVAKNEDTFKFISEALKQRRIRIFYTAIVLGRPAEDYKEMHNFYSFNSKAKIAPDFVKNMLPIVTRYNVLSKGRPFSTLEVEQVTGNKHQIRAHLAFAGLPVLGDDVYGDKSANKKLAIRHQAMWLNRIVFEVGKKHFFEYMDKREFVAPQIHLPKLD